MRARRIAVLSGPAIERISKSVIEQVVVTNTIPATEAAKARAEDKGFVDRGAGGPGHPVDPRRDVSQYIVLA